VILAVHDGSAGIEDAGDLWGLDTFETQKALSDRYPRASVLTIGPAGETLSRTAIIINETSGAAGQGGYGAVMGSKNLKAIAVRGTGTVRISRPDDFIEMVKLQAKEKGPVSMREPLGGNFIKDEMRPYLRKFSGCYACPFQCHGVYDMPDIGRASQMCNDSWYGQRVPNASRGMWAAEDLGLSSCPLLEQSWEAGEADEKAHCRFIEELNNGIANGTSPLAQGLSRAVQSLDQGAIDLCNAIYPAWGSRVHHVRCIGGALHWATDTRGPFDSCHDYNTFGYNTKIANRFGLTGGHLIGEREVKHQTLYEGSERETVWVQHSQCVKNSLPACEFTAMPENLFDPPEMDIRIFESRILSAVTGVDYDADKMWEAGERIWNLRRAIMVMREDRHRDEDTIDPAWFGEKSSIDIHKVKAARGQVLGKPLDREKWESLKDRYYALRGWDVETGRPIRSKLEALGMKDVADGLEEAGKLPMADDG
jgi:aldehyde:ferredoxin oxidoreductase